MTFRKFVSFFLIAVFFAAALFGCAAKQPPEFDDDSDIIVFNGDKAVIYQRSSYLTPKPGDSLTGDSLIKHIHDTEKSLNIKIDISTQSNIASRMLAAVASGNTTADILLDGPSMAYDMFKAGLLMPFNELEVEDGTDIKWGTPALLSETFYEGNQYGIFPYLWCGIPEVGGMFLVNMDIIEAGGFSDPHEYLEKGEWNWENMKRTFAEATFGDENGQHIGMMFDIGTDPVLFPFVAVRSNGEEPISKTNGYYVSNLSSEKAMQAYDFITEMLTAGIIAPRSATDDLFEDTDLYAYMFCASPEFTSKEIKTGFIPFGYGPNGNKDTVSSMLIPYPHGALWAHNYFLFSSFTKFGNEELGVIADRLFDPVDTENYPNGWKDYCEANLFHYRIDYENFVKAVEGVSVINMAQIEDSYETIHDGFTKFAGGEAISSIISGISDAIQADLNN